MFAYVNVVNGNSNLYPGATEICDGIGNNCNEEIDEDIGVVWYEDNDALAFFDALYEVRDKNPQLYEKFLPKRLEDAAKLQEVINEFKRKKDS